MAAALLRASHAGPTVAVPAFAAGLTAAAGARPARTAAVTGVVALGQLSIGWLNDALDADRDAAAGRATKPVVAGDLSRRTVAGAAAAAAALTVPASLALGRAPGGWHLLLAGSGWAYDLGLKATVASPVPYLLAFGALPAVAATAAGRPPSGPLCAAGAVLGLAGHLANTVPDTAADAATGVRGLPQRLGPDRSRLGAALAVVTGAGLVLAAPARAGGRRPPAAATALLVAGALVGSGAGVARGTGGFRAVLAAAGLVVAGVVASSRSVLAGQAPPAR